MHGKFFFICSQSVSVSAYCLRNCLKVKHIKYLCIGLYIIYVRFLIESKVVYSFLVFGGIVL